MRYRVFPDVNKIGRQKEVTFIPILLGHNRQLRNKDVNVQKMRSLINKSDAQINIKKHRVAAQIEHHYSMALKSSMFAGLEPY